MFKIRETHNLKLIEKLNNKIFPNDPIYPMESDACWIVYKNDFPVGFGCLRPLVYEPGNVFFNRAGIFQNVTGNGLHKRLIGVRLSWCKKYGYENVITYVMDDNLASANNLAKMGFKMYTPANLWADTAENRSVIYFYKELK